MQFHQIHGHNIVLDDDAHKAQRVSGFCQGITFSAQPISLGQKISVLIGSIKNWRGALRIGITTHDPATFTEIPSYAIPDLTSRPGFWAKALHEQWASNGNKISFYINKEGQLQLFVNNEYKGVHLSGLPFSQVLWVLLDIYGTTNSVRVVDEDEEIPREIVAQGPKAMQIYHQACRNGTLPLYRIRLMLLGLAGTGKTSLKKALLHQRFLINEASTEGIDTSSSCEINLFEPNIWHTQVNNQVIPYHKTKGSSWGQSFSLEEEYAQAFAANIAQELLSMRKKKKISNADLVTNSSKCEGLDEESKDLWYFNNEDMDVGGESLDHPSVWSKVVLEDLPDSVARLVQDILQEAETKQDIDLWETEKMINNVTISLNIWDFSGNPAYYTTHQIFLTSRAVYVLVFNLSMDLHASANTTSLLVNMQNIEREFSNLDYLLLWLNMIHSNIANNVEKNEESGPQSPWIFIVGTHRENVHSDPEIQSQMIEKQFHILRESFKGKPFIHHIVTPFYAIDSSLEVGEDDQLFFLQKQIVDIINNEAYMGEQIPLRWLKFEETLRMSVDQSIFYITLDQIREIALDEGILSSSELQTMLQYFHDLGVVIYYGGVGAIDSCLQNTVILKPQWLMELFKRIITARDTYEQWPIYTEAWMKLDQDGILDDHLIDYIWKDSIDQKMVLIGLMEKFDLLCERISINQINNFESEMRKKSYYVPSRIRKCPDLKNLYSVKKNDVVFYLDFNGFFSDGLFHRLLIRAVRWSQECGGREPRLYHRVSRFFIDFEHDFVLHMTALQYARIKVSILRVADFSNYDDADMEDTYKDLPPPDPVICAKVRNFLESTLDDLKEMWMKQISYKTCVPCFCEKVCAIHQCKSCKVESCLHFLSLDECLTNKIICCDYQRIKTSHIQKWFPSATLLITSSGPIIPENIVIKTKCNETVIECKDKMISSHLPSWVKRAAKLLNVGSPGTDWLALAEKLGYGDFMIEKFSNDINPGLTLIMDWILSSGNTILSVSTLTSYLEQISREDVVDIILKSQEEDAQPPPIFISYQWDIQDDAVGIKNVLEKAGYLCWMDIGQMGGGDLLNAKIYQGINNAKVILACITPKYTVSHSCNKELSLADLLRKPIIPIMVKPTVWPPPGSMALIFSQMLYINLKGAGGHGGTGQQASFDDRLNEILQKISCYCTPDTAVIESFSLIKKQAELSKKPSQKSVMSEIPQTLHVESLVQNGSGTMEQKTSEPSDETNFQSEPHVPQVNITKCTICTIL